MREVKFRGKRKGSSIWFYGGYAAGSYDMKHNPKTYKHNIITDAMAIIEVDPNTVGEYTGLKDRNGVEIYEGDIVHWYEIGGSYMTEKVFWEEDRSGFYPVNSWRPSLPEVIGNIHENPELLKDAT
jgi:uncharacterized phage protein (TIGR01671 family)